MSLHVHVSKAHRCSEAVPDTPSMTKTHLTDTGRLFPQLTNRLDCCLRSLSAPLQTWLSIKQTCKQTHLGRRVCSQAHTHTPTHAWRLPLIGFHKYPSAESLFVSICLQVGMLIILSQGWHHQVNLEIWSNLSSFDLLPSLPVYFCPTPTAAHHLHQNNILILSTDLVCHWQKVLFIMSCTCRVISYCNCLG